MKDKIFNIIIIILVIIIIIVGIIVYQKKIVGDLIIQSNDIELYVGNNSDIDVNYTGKKNVDIVCEVYDSSIASINNKTVTGLKEGNTTVNCSIKELNLEKTVNVKVNNIKVQKITFKDKNISLIEGEDYQLEYVIEPFNATIKSVYFTSTDNNIISITGNGFIKTNAPGDVVITVHADNNQTDMCSITIKRKHIILEKIELENSYTINVDDELELKPKLIPSDADDQNLIWQSDNPSIVTVKDGHIKGIKSGNATITVTNSSNEVTKKIKIVVNKKVEKIHFIKQTISSDAILLESNGHYAMVDTGYNECNNYTLKYLREHQVKKLDFILITHNHDDHIGCGTAILNSEIKVDKIYIKTFIINDSSSGNAKRYTKFISTANSKNVPITYIEKAFNDGNSFNFGDMNIKLYNTVQRMASKPYKGSNENYNSVMQLVTVNGIKTFLTADSYSGDIMQGIVNKVGKVHVLKMPHHGYRSCSMNTKRASQLSPNHIIITNSTAVKGKSYCIADFSDKIPTYYVNNQKMAVVVDYTNGNAVVTTN